MEKRPARLDQPPTDPFGPWMFVSKANKARIPKHGGHTVGQKSGGYHQAQESNMPSAPSKFVVLAVAGTEEEERVMHNPKGSKEKETATDSQQKTGKKDSRNGYKLLTGTSSRPMKKKEGKSHVKSDGNKRWKEKVTWEESGSGTHDGVMINDSQDHMDSTDQRENEESMGQQATTHGPKDKPKWTSKRTHIVVAGELGLMPKEIKKAQQMDIDATDQGEKSGLNAQDRVFPVQDRQNRSPAHTNTSKLPYAGPENMVNAGDEAKPPGPENNGEEEYWEEVATNLADDQDAEIIPDSLEKS